MSKIECLTKNVTRFKPLTIFIKKIHLKCFDRVLDMPLDYLNCFDVVLKGIHGKVYICQTDYGINSKQSIFPYPNAIHGSTTLKLTKG